MPLVPGDRVGAYEILSLLGAGGMGQVYRARDSKLQRDVAIKVLPEEFARDTDRLARIRREAQVLASLNHPNVAAIYGLEDASGDVSLALEFVDGEDLSERIAHHPLPFTEALELARQIADGLEAAHAKGIVHRDLKPANIKVTADHVVKILDFGLARDAAGANLTSSAPFTQSPTLTSPIALTAQGVILGTAAYMAPEQARGAATDSRADLWAFGVVLWEMLTGRRLFGGDTVSDILAAVLTRDVPWSDLPAETPPGIRRLLQRCLERDRKKRLGDARTARLDIDDALAGADTHELTHDAARGARSRAAWLAALAMVPLTALVVGGATWALSRPGPAVRDRLTLSIVLPDGMRMTSVGTMGAAPNLAPDGSAVLIRTDVPRGLYVRALASGELAKVPGSEDTSTEAFWHGSSRLTFPVRQGASHTLLDMRLPDGVPETLLTAGPMRSGTWLADGTLLVSVFRELLRWRGGTVDTIAFPGSVVMYPEAIGGTDQLLVWRDGEVCLVTFREGAVSELKVLFENDTAARYTPSGGGRVLFVKNDNLYAQRLNLTTRGVEGDAELVARGVVSQPDQARADFSVADNGTIAWRPGRVALSQVVTFDRTGKALGVSGRPGVISSIELSPREPTLFVSGQPSMVVDAGETMAAPMPQGFTTEGLLSTAGWLADGALGVVDTNRQVKKVARDGFQTSLGAVAPGVGLLKVSPDGRVAFGQQQGSRLILMWTPLSSEAGRGSWTPLFDVDEVQSDASPAPDGRFVVYTGSVGKGASVFVQPLPGTGRRQTIDTGDDPVWRADGREILYLKDNGVWSVSVSTSGAALQLGRPQRVFDGLRLLPGRVMNNRVLAVSADGSRIYVVQALEQPKTDVIHVQMDVVRP